MALYGRLLLVAMGAILAVGCDKGSDRPSTYAVTGTVTLDGQAVEGAAVTFSPKGGGDMAIGKTGASGEYSLKAFGTEEGAVPGEYTVSITKFKQDEAVASGGGTVDNSGEMPDDYEGAEVVEDGEETAEPESENALPAMYQSGSTSGFTFTVTEDPEKNVFDLPLKSQGN